MVKIIAFLPAKGISTRVKSKNIALLDGEPLFLITLKKLLEIDLIDEVYLDTESEEIISLAKHLPCKIHKRNKDLANNKTDGHNLFYNEVKNYDADIYLQILCTSPFLSKKTIEKGINVLLENTNYDSVVGVRKDKFYLWSKSGPLYDFENIPNSFDLDNTIIEGMSLYVVRKEVALSDKKRIGKKPFLLPLSPIEFIDINTQEDFKFAEIVSKGINENNISKLNLLKHHLSTTILSDVLDDLGVKSILSRDFNPNFKCAKFIGRAKTLEIKEMGPSDNYKDIYRSMDLYDFVRRNDVVVVKNNVPHLAFFGELNASLAIRKGASGAVIDGVTRDNNETIKLNFPVFAKGRYAKDIRKRGVVKSINKPIEIDNVLINPDDLIFADLDGIIVIPKKIESLVIKNAIIAIENESKIKLGILKEKSSDYLLDSFGDF